MVWRWPTVVLGVCVWATAHMSTPALITGETTRRRQRMYTRLEMSQYLSFVFFYVLTPDTQDNISSTADGHVPSRTGVARCWRVWTLVCEQWTWHLSFSRFLVLSDCCVQRLVQRLCVSVLWFLYNVACQMNFFEFWLLLITTLSWRLTCCRWPICA